MDLESRTHRKRCVGRWRKQVGDLSLQAGLTSEALEHYQAAADMLRPANDWYTLFRFCFLVIGYTVLFVYEGFGLLAHLKDSVLHLSLYFTLIFEDPLLYNELDR